ncbi:MAG TPA: hypothetical protein VL335_00155 [Candidatus Paceibacterota bacterium]|jgi:hypothetical protein|nr:hypothetical protein [Candidatus Paceibacterota bacterium]
MKEVILNLCAWPFVRARAILVQLKRDKAKKRALRLIAELDNKYGRSGIDVQRIYLKIEHVREHYSIPYAELGLVDWADLRNRVTIAESRWDTQFQSKPEASASKAKIEPKALPTVRIC